MFKHTPAEARALWLAALRSGEYQQTRASLCRLGLQGQPVGYCCLGVACETFRQHEAELPIGHRGPFRQYDRETALPPNVVREWLGLKTFHGAYGDGQPDTLTFQNDRGKTFAEIADLIEDKAESLFV